MSHGLGAQTQMEHGKNLGAGIDGEPVPQDLLGVAQPGAQFVEAAGAGGAGYGSSAGARSVHARAARVSQVVIVACR
jgi:hypothetical protein